MSCGLFLWMGQHWHYMAVFLQKAILFRYAFAEPTLQIDRKIRSRKRLVVAIEIFGFSVVIGLLVYTCVTAE